MDSCRWYDLYMYALRRVEWDILGKRHPVLGAC